MATRRTTTVVEQTVAQTYLPNALESLRALFVHIDDKGHAITVDLPIIGWGFGPDMPPTAIVPGGVPKQTQLAVLWDATTKVWLNPATGETFDSWQQVVRPLYATYDLRPKESVSEPITTPSVGGIGLAAGNWPGQPKPWKAGRS